MAYIVQSELPQTCNECVFRVCKFSHPFWATDMGDKCGKQGFYCMLDTQNPRRIMVVDFGDKTKKMEWCPLKEIVLCESCEKYRTDDCAMSYTDREENMPNCWARKNDFCSRGERKDNG